MFVTHTTLRVLDLKKTHAMLFYAITMSRDNTINVITNNDFDKSELSSTIKHHIEYIS